jgi:hypothetical protein
MASVRIRAMNQAIHEREIARRRRTLQPLLDEIEALLVRAYPDQAARDRARAALVPALPAAGELKHARNILQVKVEPDLREVWRLTSIAQWACWQLGFTAAQEQRMLDSIWRAHIPDDREALRAYWHRCASRLLRWLYCRRPDAPVIPFAAREGLLPGE